jgi:hypothetical protein
MASLLGVPPDSADIDTDAGPRTPPPPHDLQHIARVALLKSSERGVREDTIPEPSSPSRAADFQQEGTDTIIMTADDSKPHLEPQIPMTSCSPLPINTLRSTQLLRLQE